MKTSYFSKLKTLKLTPKNLVSIAVKNPPGFNVRKYNKLCPPWEIIVKYKNGGDKDEYTTNYHKMVLDKLDPQKVYNSLGENAVLLCWESSEKFCHRHLVAVWFKDNLGIEVLEL